MFKYIFYFRDNIISAYYFRNSIFESLKYKGDLNIYFEKEEFWKWWKEKVNYNGENVDFCIVSDTKIEQPENGIEYSNETTWKKDEISSFLKMNKIKEEIKIATFPSMLEDKEVLEKTIFSVNHLEKEVIEIKGNESPLARHFLKKTLDIDI
ncbi:hypothetical protein ACQ9ZF_03665 [Cetobacterium somerae]|uniref:hypothetical protein n=1 Tax=Cetobacterium somerae TaxID=188913 RepID=UPI003D768F7F